jgi:hypothetical protein
VPGCKTNALPLSIDTESPDGHAGLKGDVTGTLAFIQGNYAAPLTGCARAEIDRRCELGLVSGRDHYYLASPSHPGCADTEALALMRARGIACDADTVQKMLFPSSRGLG